MSDKYVCYVCHGQGKKMSPDGDFLLCWHCGGKRKTYSSRYYKRSWDMGYAKDTTTDFRQNSLWYCYCFNRHDLGDWAVQKRLERSRS